MSNGKKQTSNRKPTRKERPVKGRTVYIGERPKMPLIIAGIFIAGLLMIILATIFSPKKSGGTPPPPASTNAPAGAVSPGTNAPAPASQE